MKRRRKVIQMNGSLPLGRLSRTNGFSGQDAICLVTFSKSFHFVQTSFILTM